MAALDDRPSAGSPELDDDDDALSWAGDDLRGGIDPLTRNRAADVAESSVVDVDAAPTSPGNLAGASATVLFALVYLAVVVGWILSVQVTGSAATDVFSQVAWQFGEFVAIISGALWYLAVLTLAGELPTGVRVAWFALGVGILVPWPILLALL